MRGNVQYCEATLAVIHTYEGNVVGIFVPPDGLKEGRIDGRVDGGVEGRADGLVEGTVVGTELSSAVAKVGSILGFTNKSKTD